MAKLPNGERAIIDPRKLTAYALNPAHPNGRHKARVFKAALGLDLATSQILMDALAEAAGKADAVLQKSDRYGLYYRVDFEMTFGAKSATVRSAWAVCIKMEYRGLRRFGSNEAFDVTKTFPVLLDVVALLRDLPEERLERGAVGTVVEIMREPDVFLIEFADRDGGTIAMPTLEAADLLVLQYERAAAAE